MYTLRVRGNRTAHLAADQPIVLLVRVGWRVKFIISAGVNIIVRRQPKVLRDPNDFIIEGLRYKYNNTTYIYIYICCFNVLLLFS